MTREQGPFDVSEVDLADGAQRVDLGSLLVPAVDGMDVQVQLDEQSGQVVQASVTVKGSAVQLQPYAAPKSGGMWDEVRPQIKASVMDGGGLVEETEGAFGRELHAQVKGNDGVLQPARFVGVDGPRWFLRAVFLGASARPGSAADQLDDLVRGCVIIRGGDAMPVGAAIPMHLPSQEQSEPPASGRPPLDPFARGPEITEIR